ncbi:hypothetical protein BFJ71_g2995 [Fusarium oxysporum]|nr:hypothetical protein BFJ71_g2995 [Fusarium oxysporum]
MRAKPVALCVQEEMPRRTLQKGEPLLNSNVAILQDLPGFRARDFWLTHKIQFASGNAEKPNTNSKADPTPQLDTQAIHRDGLKDPPKSTPITELDAPAESRALVIVDEDQGADEPIPDIFETLDEMLRQRGNFDEAVDVATLMWKMIRNTYDQGINPSSMHHEPGPTQSERAETGPTLILTHSNVVSGLEPEIVLYPPIEGRILSRACVRQFQTSTDLPPASQSTILNTFHRARDVQCMPGFANEQAIMATYNGKKLGIRKETK